jgi:alpha-tubulin suppressor-like RCC1 family protein
MDSSTINATNITVADSSGNAVGGVVSYNSNVATFNPSSDLSYSKSYTITVSTGVKDSAGNALGSSSNRNFTTIDLPTAISSGANSTCAILSDKTVKCWGATGGGQLGDNVNSSTSVPVSISGISTAISISSNGVSSCTLLSDKTVKCWGENVYGKLGDGTTTYRSTPVTVSSISDVITVGNATYHSCALLSNNTVKCWGNNDWGQLGDGSTTSSTTPVTVSGISNATAITVSKNRHTCVLLSDNSVKCWGLNTYGQLGDNSTTNRTTPVTVSGISTAIAVTGGRSHTCALLSNSTVQCWGYNYYGQLGNGSTILQDQQRTTPVTVSGISNATAISAGDYHNCALLSSNTVQCWGSNGAGQLGNGTSGYSSSRSTPVTVQF